MIGQRGKISSFNTENVINHAWANVVCANVPRTGVHNFLNSGCMSHCNLQCYVDVLFMESVQMNECGLKTISFPSLLKPLPGYICQSIFLLAGLCSYNPSDICEWINR